MSEEDKLDPGHASKRGVLRLLGPLLLVLGAIFMLVGLVDFFSAMGSVRGPQHFWCFFVGMPLLFFGGVFTMTGFAGAIARYQAGEAAPVLKDSFNYLADGTSRGVKAMTTAAAAGIRAGLSTDTATAVRCRACGAENDAGAEFCAQCGKPMHATKKCAGCGAMNAADARFCDRCGKAVV